MVSSRHQSSGIWPTRTQHPNRTCKKKPAPLKLREIRKNQLSILIRIGSEQSPTTNGKIIIINHNYNLTISVSIIIPGSYHHKGEHHHSHNHQHQNTIKNYNHQDHHHNQYQLSEKCFTILHCPTPLIKFSYRPEWDNNDKAPVHFQQLLGG